MRSLGLATVCVLLAWSASAEEPMIVAGRPGVPPGQLLTLDAASGGQRGISWRTGGATTWELTTPLDATGEKADQSLALYSFSNTGAFIGNPLEFSSGQSQPTAQFNWLVSLAGNVGSNFREPNRTIGQYGSFSNKSGLGQIGTFETYSSNAGSDTFKGFDFADVHIYSNDSTSLEKASSIGAGVTWRVGVTPYVPGNWGFALEEGDLVNRLPDHGPHFIHTQAPNPVAGITLVADSALEAPAPPGVFTHNADWAFVVSSSYGNNIDPQAPNFGFPNKWYSGMLVAEDSIVGGTGYGAYINGDITHTASQQPYSPVGVNADFLHGVTTTQGRFADGMAFEAALDQTIGFTDGKRQAGISTSVEGSAVNLTAKAPGNIMLNAAAAIPTTAVTGFVSPPFMEGKPTGTPSVTSAPSCVWNDLSSTLNCWSPHAHAWRHLTFAPGAG